MSGGRGILAVVIGLGCAGAIVVAAPGAHGAPLPVLAPAAPPAATPATPAPPPVPNAPSARADSAAVSAPVSPPDTTLLRLRAALLPHPDRGDPARFAELDRVHSSVLPPAGILLAGFTADLYSIEYSLLEGAFRSVSFRDLSLSLAWSPVPWWRLSAVIPHRSWAATAGLLPPGGGLGDVRITTAIGLPSPSPLLAWSAWGGATMATGNRSKGLGEGRPAPEAGVGATLRLWRSSRFPEMRLHLNGGWRRNPDGGRGGGPSGYEPWPPIYPPVPPGGSPADNDFLLLGGAVEMRRANVSLYVEYTEARLPHSAGIASAERQHFLTPGLHWGAARGWGLSLAYDISLALDDAGTPFVPAYPDLVYHLELSRGFGLRR